MKRSYKNQKRRTTRHMMIVSTVVAIFIATTTIVAFAYAQSNHSVFWQPSSADIVPLSTAVNGRLYAEITIGNNGNSGSSADSALRDELAALILEAEQLRDETVLSEDGIVIPVSSYWARQSDFDAFQTAINEARRVYDSTTDFLSPGDEIEVTVSIEDNTGFAAMILRLNVPDGLELVGMRVNTLLPNILVGFDGVEDWDGTRYVNPPMRGNTFAGWTGRTATMGNFAGNGELITYTLRVSENAVDGLTEPITLAFANNRYPFFELPTDVHFNELQISINGQLGLGQVAELGRIQIGQPAISDLFISVDPGSRTIVNRVNQSVSFTVTVGGMPPGTIPITSEPTPPGMTGVAVSGLPDGIEASGSVTIGADGRGSGTLTLRIVSIVPTGTDIEEELTQIAEQLFGN